MTVYSNITDRRVYVVSKSHHSSVKPGTIWYTQAEFAERMHNYA